MEQILSLREQLFLKHAANITAEPILYVNPDSVQVISEVLARLPNARVHAHFINFGLFKAFNKVYGEHTNVTSSFDSWLSTPEKFKTAIIFLPSTRELIRMTLSMVSQHLHAEAFTFLLGQKNEGIKSANADLETYIGAIDFSDSARHSTIYRAVRNIPPTTDTLQSWKEQFEVTIEGKRITAVTFPGVFSHGRLDDGTAMLIKTLSGINARAVLDWGCGSGIIGMCLRTLLPEVQIHFADTNAIALAATRETCALNNIENISVFPTDVFSEVSEKYDLIIANPPFHTGVQTNYHPVETFIAQARSHLLPGGELRVVANTFLRYKPHLQTAFGNCRTLAGDKSYTVYSCIRQ